MSGATRTPRYHAVDDQPLAYSVDRLALALSLGKDLIWRALNTGELHGCYVGRRLLIEREEALRWLGTLPAYEPAIPAT